MRELQTDFLVLGSGIAGLWFSLRASRYGRVLVATKKEDSESNTNYAQGGIAAAVGADDSPLLHQDDTIAAGAGLARPEIVRLVTEQGPVLVRELAEVGVEFSRMRDSRGFERFALGQEGGHRRRRIVHTHDRTGYEIEKGLLRAVRAGGNVTIAERHFARRLTLSADGRCCGAELLDSAGSLLRVRARACMLATGGIGQCYLHTTNPPIATGDGIAMAYSLGAMVGNMEFIQFHPTALHGRRIDGRAFLISEALRGEGAVLRTRDGEAFMRRYHLDAELAPRDVVARAIAAEMRRRGDDHVCLDATHIAPVILRERFPTITQTCLQLGIDITRQQIPVVPAAHYVCGGVMVNSWGETTVPGLFAAGECSCTGLHGANRLASNSLLEALVFADRAAQRAVAAPWPGAAVEAEEQDGTDLAEDDAAVAATAVRSVMWNRAGIVRTDEGLRLARSELAGVMRSLAGVSRTPFALEARSMVVVSRLVVECALRRSESRGLHYNEDHPQQEDRFRHDTVVSRQELGEEVEAF
uniref:L-aspartate oxidase n=1 Tax=candidate division WOR-3 bacterium TaxID=2052148 RepID=A0A7C4CAU6_UNCW3